jgi:hypothetical protein
MSGNEREIQRSIEANKTGRKCETCGNEIRKSDDRATERQCGFCATVHPANAKGQGCEAYPELHGSQEDRT